MPTRSGWFVAVGGLAMIVAGRLLGLAELYLLGTCALVLPLVALILVRQNQPILDVRRILRPTRVMLGGVARVEATIVNLGGRRTPVLTLHDPVEGTVGARLTVAPMPPGEQQTASYRLPTQRRGLVHVGPMAAQVVDPFGLARRRVSVAGVATLTVLPAIERLERVTAGGGIDDPMAGATRTVLGRTGGDEFAGLRPYVVGDDMRRVHWASSARIGDLLVRQDDPPWQGHLTILLDARTGRCDVAGFEVAVSASASLVQTVAEKGDRIRLVITDGSDSGLVDARATRDTLLERLALVDQHGGGALPEPPLDGGRRRGDLVVISGGLEPDEISRLQGLRSRFAHTRLVLTHPTGPEPGSSVDLEVLTVAPGSTFADAWHASVVRQARR